MTERSDARHATLLLVLQDDERIMTTADACRDAASIVLAGNTSRWTSAELIAWVAGPFRKAARSGSRRQGTVFHEDLTRLTPAEVQMLVRSARAFVAAELELARWNRVEEAFRCAINAGLVVRACDVTGQGGFLPADRGGLTLAERVLSLVAADYLTRPQDYRHHLHVCAICEGASLDQSCACPPVTPSGVRLIVDDTADLPAVRATAS